MDATQSTRARHAEQALVRAFECIAKGRNKKGRISGPFSIV